MASGHEQLDVYRPAIGYVAGETASAYGIDSDPDFDPDFDCYKEGRREGAPDRMGQWNGVKGMKEGGERAKKWGAKISSALDFSARHLFAFECRAAGHGC